MSKDKYPSTFSPQIAPNGGYCVYYPSNLFCNARSFENWGIFNNCSPKLRYTKTVREYTPPKINLDDFFTCHGCKSGRHFFPSCSEVNSRGYSELDEPISARLQRYPLF